MNFLRASVSASFASSLLFLVGETSHCAARPATLASSSFDSDLSLINALSLATTLPSYTFLPHKAVMKNGEGFLVVFSPRTRSPLFTIERLVSHGEGSGTSASDKYGNKRPPFFTDPRLDSSLASFQVILFSFFLSLSPFLTSPSHF